MSEKAKAYLAAQFAKTKSEMPTEDFTISVTTLAQFMEGYHASASAQEEKEHLAKLRTLRTAQRAYAGWKDPANKRHAEKVAAEIDAYIETIDQKKKSTIN